MKLPHIHIVVFGAMLSFFASCSENDETLTQDLPDPVINGFSPADGILGNIVSISGENFSPLPVDNIVQFNGTPATIQSASTNELTVVVPDSATTGNLKVTVGGKAATSSAEFTILVPVLEMVAPMIASPGILLKIDGLNFSDDVSKNMVMIGGMKANIINATPTQIEAEIAEGSPSGNLTVRVGTQRVSTEGEIQICDGMPELLISDVVIKSTNPQMDQLSFSCRLTNVGNVDLDLSKMIMQNYVSEDGQYDYGDSPAGGWVLSSGGILAQGESYENTWSSNADYTSKKNLIITVYVKEGESLEECNTSNNVVIQKIE